MNILMCQKIISLDLKRALNYCLSIFTTSHLVEFSESGLAYFRIETFPTQSSNLKKAEDIQMKDKTSY